MSPGPPKAQPFKDLLTGILEAGKRTTRITAEQIDRLLNAEDFDETEYDLFLDIARELGIDILDHAPEATSLDRGASLDSLKIYLADISARPEIRAMAQQAVDKANERLSRPEQVKAWELLPVEWTAESEELTPTFKLKRRVVNAKYAEVVDGLYAT